MNDNSCVLAEFEEFNLEGTIVIIYKTWYKELKGLIYLISIIRNHTEMTH